MGIFFLGFWCCLKKNRGFNDGFHRFHRQKDADHLLFQMAWGQCHGFLGCDWSSKTYWDKNGIGSPENLQETMETESLLGREDVFLRIFKLNYGIDFRNNPDEPIIQVRLAVFWLTCNVTRMTFFLSWWKDSCPSWILGCESTPFHLILFDCCISLLRAST